MLILDGLDDTATNDYNIATEKDGFSPYHPTNCFLDNKKIFKNKTNIDLVEIDYDELRTKLEKKK